MVEWGEKAMTRPDGYENMLIVTAWHKGKTRSGYLLPGRKNKQGLPVFLPRNGKVRISEKDIKKITTPMGEITNSSSRINRIECNKKKEQARETKEAMEKQTDALQSIPSQRLLKLDNLFNIQEKTEKNQ